MFGYVTANMEELTQAQRDRYGAVYCGICRSIREHYGQLSGLTLQYDMAFLALLLMSLYEPEERSGKDRCLTHPIRKREWVSSDIIRYCADMNVALAYWKCLDDWQDDGSRAARWMAKQLEGPCQEIAGRYPRQWETMEHCLRELTKLEKEGCTQIDRCAGEFGALMGQLLVFREDHWTAMLQQLGDALGRFVYLMDAAVDCDRDAGKGSYNPWLAGEKPCAPEYREDCLVNILGRCTTYFEALPLVQDKALLDNILYSGVWVNYQNKRKEAKPHG